MSIKEEIWLVCLCLLDLVMQSDSAGDIRRANTSGTKSNCESSPCLLPTVIASYTSLCPGDFIWFVVSHNLTSALSFLILVNITHGRIWWNPHMKKINESSQLTSFDPSNPTRAKTEALLLPEAPCDAFNPSGITGNESWQRNFSAKLSSFALFEICQCSRSSSV